MACPRDDPWIKIPNQTSDPVICSMACTSEHSALLFRLALLSYSCKHFVFLPSCLQSKMIHSSLLYRGCKKTPIHRECCFGPKHGVVWCHSCTAAHSCVVCKHSTTDPRYPLVLSMAVRVWWKRSTGSDDGFYF